MVLPIEQTEAFLKGPIPWAAIHAAAQIQSPVGLYAYLWIWHHLTLHRKRRVRCPYRVLARGLGLSKETVKRALVAIEQLGLVELDRQRGRCPWASIPIHPNCEA